MKTPPELKILVFAESESDLGYYRSAVSEEREQCFLFDFADSLEAVLCKLRDEKPDCLILDVPDEGEECVTQVGRVQIEFPFLPIVVLAAKIVDRATITALSRVDVVFLIKEDLSSGGLGGAINRTIEHIETDIGENADARRCQQILIIDDCPEDRELYERALKSVEECEYEIHHAEYGEEGISKLRQLNPDCVLLDYSLPDMDGVEVLRTIRAEWTDLPIIVLSGVGNEEVAVEAMKLGAQDYMSKHRFDGFRMHRMMQAAIDRFRLQSQLANQRDALSMFTYALSHDLKEPIRTIQSYSSLLEEEVLSSAGKEYLGAIGDSANFMNHLVLMVHSFTQIDAVEIEKVGDLYESRDLVDTALRNLDSLIKSKPCEIEAESLPSVHVYDIQLISVFQNIIANAIKYNDKDVAKIVIKSRVEGNNHQFSIRDNGTGIDTRFLSRIFEPFKRASAGERGTGLGLAIVKKVIELHKGRIWVESDVGKGTTFHFTLPKVAASGKLPEQTDVAKKVVLRHPKQYESHLANVLLVEDSPPDIRLTELMLKGQDRLQFNFHSAHNGDEALKFLADSENAAVDLILLDVNMPILDGFSFLKAMRRTVHHSLPVVMCTTSEYEPDRHKSVELGARGYIVKPPRLEKLEGIIESIPSLSLERKDDGFLLSAHN